MADESNPTTSGRFVRKGFILRDLLLSMQAQSPSLNAQTLKQRLAIPQNCDFTQQLKTAFSSNSEFSLPAYIRQYVRNNASDTTDLPSMERFYVNARADALGSSRLALQRISDAAVPILTFAEATQPADFLATKATPWTQSGGVFTFRRSANVWVNFSFNLAMNVLDTPLASNLQWRFSNSGTNRVVTVTPTIHLEGSLNSGSRLDIALGSVSFFPEHYERDVRLPIQRSLKLAVADAAGAFGRIDKLSVSLQRTSWVAQNSAGAYDRVFIPKRTAAAVLDSTNFLELTEA